MKNVLKYFLLTAASVGAIAATAQTSLAQVVLYSDGFSRTTGSGDANGDPNGPGDNFSDWGTNDNALGGTNSQAWIAGPDRFDGGRNAVTDGDRGLSHGTSSFYDFDVTSSAPDGFTIALDFRRYPQDPLLLPGPNGFIAFGLGVDSGSIAAGDSLALNNADWSILFQQSANENTGNSNVYTDTALDENFDYGEPDIEHSLLLTVTPQSSGAYGDSDAVNINLLIDGTLSKDFATTGGADFGTFTVSANNFEARYIDNLVVSAIEGVGSIPGDFDNNGIVDDADIDALSANFGQPATTNPAMDLDGNNTIELADHDLHITTQVMDANGTGALIGDLNFDGDVDVSQIVVGAGGVQNFGDASVLLANLGSTSGQFYANGDLNGDGDVDVSQIVAGAGGVQNLGDASRLLANLGETTTATPAASTVPEPSSLAVMVLAGINAFTRRRR